MMRTKRFFPKTVTAIVVIVFLGISGIWADNHKEPEFKPIAEEMIGAGGISWAPKVNYYQLVLTIARPDGSVFRKTFDSGATPYVGLSGIFGERADDGAYTYELTLVPNIERRVRSSNDDTLIARTQDRRVLPRKALTQSGAFTVKGGMIVTDSMTEPEAGGAGSVISTSTADNGISRTLAQVFTTDLIVQGSACVGIDCTSSESFGFDTIRLKENNLRIKFQDTSVSASFPSNDWQLTANESSNGGANKFSIDDIDGGRTPFTIEASAPSHSLYVDDGGRVGLGTSTPVVDVHVKSGNTPTLRLEQDGSSGFTAQTWDLAGNEANFFIRDVTNGSKLSFKIKPGAPTSSIFIASDGDIGLGSESPSASLHVKAVSDDPGIYVETNSTTNAKVIVEKDGGARGVVGSAGAFTFFGSESDNALRLYVNNAWRMRLNISSNSKLLEMSDNGYYDGTWHGSSSRALKENIINLTAQDAVNTLDELTPVRFNYKTNKEDEHVGFIAEDVPDLVATKDRKTLGAMDVVAVLTKVVKEQQKAIAELKKEIAELKKK